MRAQDALSLDDLNRALGAWLGVTYHDSVHSETGQTPKARYDTGLTVIRHVEMDQVLASFMRKVTRIVHKDFSDISLDKRLYRVDANLRGDKVWVHFDPFSSTDTVSIYSLKDEYQGKGTLHHRESSPATVPAQPGGKPKHDYLDLLVREHELQLAASSRGIDYRKVVSRRPWPFLAFAKTLARLLGKVEGLSAFSAQELESLKKFYNQNAGLTEPALVEAFSKTHCKSFPHLIFELKQILQSKEYPPMFLDHFKMSAHPFQESPPTEWILNDERFSRTLARLEYFSLQGHLALVIGQTGVGKSTLLRLFIQNLSKNRYRPVYLHFTGINPSALLRLIVAQLGEAHLIDPQALTDLRLLISSAVDTDIPLKIVLSGQESLARLLARASLKDLLNRITVRSHLGALGKDQTSSYLDSRMRFAGSHDKVFEGEAKGLIHDYASGIPRQINNIATACLLNASARDMAKINDSLVNDTMAEFHLP